MNISAIILAAGASSRMGGDKALLKLPDGTTLLEDQIRRVMAAGISNVRVVLGHNSDVIRDTHQSTLSLPSPIPSTSLGTGKGEGKIEWVINSNWQSGYFSSIKCGMAGVNTGAILLPLDTVGVPHEVIGQIRDMGINSGKNVIPTYEGKGGHPVFLRPELIKNILAVPLSSRLDHLLQADKETLKLPVSSKNILNNINTPDEWAKWL